MNVRTFHQETIRGLLRNTVNRTHLDFEQRELIPLGTVVDWTDLRTFNQEINNLFASCIDSDREQAVIGNLIIEVRLRINHLLPIIANPQEYERALATGVKVYSRYIKNNWITRANQQHGGFFQSLEDQTRWGILEEYQVGFLVNPCIIQYLEFEHHVTGLTNRLFRDQGANPNFNKPQVQDAKQNLC